MILQGRKALITGATSGIGLAIAKAFAAKGADIVFNGMGEKHIINAIEDELRQFNIEATYSDADMSKPDQIYAMLDMAGDVDVLVNNVGIQHVSPIEDFSPEKWDQILAINLSSAFHCIHGTFSHMKQQNWGRIINIASAHALIASPFKSAYVAAKHGLFGLTKTVALEGAKHGVTCNAICPGYVWTPLVENQIKATATARGISEEDVINNILLAAQPTGKFTTVEQIADLALFLVSDSAQNITGSPVSIDGGWVAH